MGYLQTQVGYIELKWNSAQQLERIEFASESAPTSETIPNNLLSKLKEYFESGYPLGDIPWDIIDQSEWTDFQKSVYKAITFIPHGETRTYSWVAQKIGKPLAVRAVGQALRNNPIPVLIPCHRVVAANSLGGFMGSNNPQDKEMQIKKFLLKLEEEYLNPVFSFLEQSA
jgi:methylated-DNA-[protein]-cysteine S-methyltransferase